MTARRKVIVQFTVTFVVKCDQNRRKKNKSKSHSLLVTAIDSYAGCLFLHQLEEIKNVKSNYGMFVLTAISSKKINKSNIELIRMSFKS